MPHNFPTLPQYTIRRTDPDVDIVTLATFRISREPSDLLHPYGYGKYECLGSLLVSFLLIGTALGIGKLRSHRPDHLLTR